MNRPSWPWLEPHHSRGLKVYILFNSVKHPIFFVWLTQKQTHAHYCWSITALYIVSIWNAGERLSVGWEAECSAVWLTPLYLTLSRAQRGAGVLYNPLTSKSPQAVFRLYAYKTLSIYHYAVRLHKCDMPYLIVVLQWPVDVSVWDLPQQRVLWSGIHTKQRRESSCNTLGVVWNRRLGSIVFLGVLIDSLDLHTRPLNVCVCLLVYNCGCVSPAAMHSYSCVLKMTVSIENPMEAASPRSGFNSTVRMKVTTQTSWRYREKENDVI